MCMRLILPDGREISSYGELRKWAYPVYVIYKKDYEFPPRNGDCLCPVDWDALGKAMGKTFTPTAGCMDMTIGGDDGKR